MAAKEEIPFNEWSTEKEKVLGFKEKKLPFEMQTTNNEKAYAVFEKDLIPVVSLEWLEEYCREHLFLVNKFKGHYLSSIEISCVNTEKLLIAAKKEAGKCE